jgi:hypothetical protein
MLAPMEVLQYLVLYLQQVEAQGVATKTALLVAQAVALVFQACLVLAVALAILQQLLLHKVLEVETILALHTLNLVAVAHLQLEPITLQILVAMVVQGLHPLSQVHRLHTLVAEVVMVKQQMALVEQVEVEMAEHLAQMELLTQVVVLAAVVEVRKEMVALA